MEMTVTVPAGCGEILQGNIETISAIVTCPINLCVQAVVSDGVYEETGLQEKSRRAVAATLAYLGEKRFPYGIKLLSAVPQGKGMSSSSADVGALIVAVAAAFGVTLSEREICAIALTVEPTNPVFCTGLAVMNRISGEIIHTFTHVPPLAVLCFDRGGIVDTLTFYGRKSGSGQNADVSEFYEELLRRPTDSRVWGRAATGSALLNQDVLYKPELVEFIRLAENCGAVGVGTAHTGTLLSMLLPEKAASDDGRDFVAAVSRTLPNLRYVGTYRFSSGGYTIERRE